jgi:NADPH2:quinone reductase
MQIVELAGPEGALRLVDVPEPKASHELTPGSGVLIDVKAALVSFPELLQTRGAYQEQPPLPFVPGGEIAGVVTAVSGDAEVAPGDRVAALCLSGGFAEVAVAPEYFCFHLAPELSFAEGAGLVRNYHTAHFSLVTRGRLRADEWVLVHGAAGGVGTAALQIAHGYGAHPVAVVSSDEKEQVARQAGAEHVLRVDQPWKDQALELSSGGIDLVLDPVGGDRVTDSLRSLRAGGRLVVVGFAGGSVPQIKVNRLLLGNTEVIGAGWGLGPLATRETIRATGRAIADLIATGAIRPIVGAHFALERASDALKLLDDRRATGKVVLDIAA